MWIESNEYNGIRIEGLKINDIKTGSAYEGCCCSRTNDRNRYDKESKTIICKNYSDCLASVIRKMSEDKRVEIKEIFEAYTR